MVARFNTVDSFGLDLGEAPPGTTCDYTNLARSSFRMDHGKSGHVIFAPPQLSMLGCSEIPTLLFLSSINK